MKCIVCRRPLTRSASAAASIGPACLRKLNGARMKRRAQPVDKPRRAQDERQSDWVAQAAEGATA